MIYFYGEGRLGNQVLQYHALSRVARPGERVFAVGLEDIGRSFDVYGPPLKVLTRNGILKRIVKYVVNPLLMRPLARNLRLFNYASEDRFGAPPNAGPGGELSIRTGHFRGFTYMDGGFYQNSSYWTPLFPTLLLRVKAAQRDSARRFLKSICRGLTPSFVHVRRGDYLTHVDYGLSDLSLPARFYRAAIRELASRVGPTHLVFVTDDPEWVEENFRDVADKAIVSSDAAADFAIMTECASAILSNSTFSLAAALMLNNPDLVIAPLYWFGFRVGTWLPPRIRLEHERLVYLPVAG